MRHPGEVLFFEFMEPLEVSQFQLAKSTGISMAVINSLLLGNSDVTEEISRRLGEQFGVAPSFFLDLQKAWDLK